ncbi:MAG: hypothetical protein JSS07_10070 [Proteobacteria bacterium]|nr:hypothetical protein [Pseudomonadota bacterium]
MKPQFYFFSSRYATKFHIANRLLALGWQNTNPSEALFSDTNLTLNDDVSKHLEYKHLLAQLLTKYNLNFLPKTYCIDDDNCQQVFAKMIYENYMVDQKYHKNIEGLKWILKPSMLNNADNIHLFNNVEELKAYYAKSQRLGGWHVIQRYITNPALIDGRKYTFRVSAVVTNYAGIFFYKNGYINISHFPFALDGFVNKKIHITNYVLDGEFSQIEQRPTQKVDNFAEIYAKMCQMVASIFKALIKAYPNYLKPSSNKIFEIFGFDFMLDDNGRLWLLEINQAPDAPTFEENKLNDILWQVFWQDILDDFVLPIALKTKQEHQYQHFTQILPAKKCYSFLSALWSRFIG